MVGPMSFGNVPPEILAGAIEKLLAKMDETDLAAFYQRELAAMPAEIVDAFVGALFAAFRERGESSEDVAEGAGTTVERIGGRESEALNALLAYARTSPDLLKEATATFVHERPDFVEMLPPALRDGLAERLMRSLP